MLPVVGLVRGGLLGAVARGWMRLIATDPEFTWSGTIFIIGAFAVWGFAQGAVAAARRATSRRWLVTIARLFGCVGMLPLFVGAGAIMAPTVLAGGLARHRTDWRTWMRIVSGLIGAVPVLVVAAGLHDDWGLGWRWWAGLAGLVAVYGTVIRFEHDTMAAQDGAWRVPGIVRVLAAVGVVVAIAVPLVGVGLG